MVQPAWSGASFEMWRGGENHIQDASPAASGHPGDRDADVRCRDRGCPRGRRDDATGRSRTRGNRRIGGAEQRCGRFGRSPRDTRVGHGHGRGHVSAGDAGRGRYGATGGGGAAAHRCRHRPRTDARHLAGRHPEPGRRVGLGAVEHGRYRPGGAGAGAGERESRWCPRSPRSRAHSNRPQRRHCQCRPTR